MSTPKQRGSDPPAPLVIDAIARWVLDTPDAVAVRAVDGALSYAQLWERSGQVAEALRADAFGPASVVGVAAGRTTQLFIALLGVLRCGAVFVPLDPSYPAERLRAMVADAGCAAVIGDKAVFELLPDAAASTVAPLELFLARTAQPRARSTDGLAYIAFTSGSTGRPKGVRYPASGLAELVAWTIADSVLGPGGRTLALTPISFDVALQEIFSTLCAGGALLCATDEQRLDPDLLWDLIERERVERVFVTFVGLQALAMAGPDRDLGTCTLREIVAGGERLRLDQDIRELCAALPRCELVNQWGTVEVLIATSHRMSGDPYQWPALPPVGRCLPFVRVDVQDPAGTPVQRGELGELVVGGSGVAFGYLDGVGRGGFGYAEGAGAIYRTGDIGRISPDGLVECLGRRDSQIKVRGHRVEPAEVEYALTARGDVLEAAVWLHDDDGDGLLCAAIVAAGAPPAGPQVQAELAKVLPAYLVPSIIEVRSDFPRTPSGKLDRAALAASAAVVR